MKQLSLDKIIERRKHSNTIQKEVLSQNIQMNRFVEKHFRVITDETILQLITSAKNNHPLTNNAKLDILQLINKKLNIHLNKNIILPKMKIEYYPTISQLSNNWQKSKQSLFVIAGQLKIYRHKNPSEMQAQFNTQPQSYPSIKMQQLSLQNYQQITVFQKQNPLYQQVSSFQQFTGIGQLFHRGLTSERATKLLALNCTLVRFKQTNNDISEHQNDVLSYDQKSQLLSYIPSLQPLGKKLIQYISSFKVKQFCFQDVIYNKGETPTSVYFIINGQISFQYMIQNEKRNSSQKNQSCNTKLEVLSPQSYFGEEEILSQKNRIYTTKAQTSKCILLQLHRDKFVKLMEYPQFAQIILNSAKNKQTQRKKKIEMAQRLIFNNNEQNTNAQPILTESDLKHFTLTDKTQNKKTFSLRRKSQQKVKVMHGNLVRQFNINTQKINFSMLKVNPDHYDATKDKFRKYRVKPYQESPQPPRNFKKLWHILHLEDILREEDIQLNNSQGRKFFDTHRRLQHQLHQSKSVRPKTTSTNYRTKIQYIAYLQQFNN